MYLGIDVGGTKTLVASLTNEGVITETFKFPTPKKYANFLLELRHGLSQLKAQDFKAVGVGMPGRIDRNNGIFVRGNNIAWKNCAVETDLMRILHTPVVLENDAKLATLSEAMLLKKHQKVLYLTISTGIGTGVAIDQKLDPDYLTMEGGQAIFEHHGKVKRWEEFASGSAIVKRYGKRAEDINDQKTWKQIAREFAPGFIGMIANVQPDIVVVGGGVGAHFTKFGKLLNDELKKYEAPVSPIPKVVGAQRPEEAVVYGCYDLAKQKYGHIT